MREKNRPRKGKSAKKSLQFNCYTVIGKKLRARARRARARAAGATTKHECAKNIRKMKLPTLDGWCVLCVWSVWRLGVTRTRHTLRPTPMSTDCPPAPEPRAPCILSKEYDLRPRLRLRGYPLRPVQLSHTCACALASRALWRGPGRLSVEVHSSVSDQLRSATPLPIRVALTA